MIPRSSSLHEAARLRCPTHLLECPHWASLHIPEVAPAEYLCRCRTWHRYRASFRWMVICIFWRLGYQAIQLFTISRGSRSASPPTPEHDHCFPGMLLSPGSFRTRVSHQTQEHPSKFLPTESGIQRSASWRTYTITCGGSLPSDRFACRPVTLTTASTASRGTEDASTPSEIQSVSRPPATTPAFCVTRPDHPGRQADHQEGY